MEHHEQRDPVGPRSPAPGPPPRCRWLRCPYGDGMAVLSVLAPPPRRADAAARLGSADLLLGNGIRVGDGCGPFHGSNRPGWRPGMAPVAPAAGRVPEATGSSRAEGCRHTGRIADDGGQDTAVRSDEPPGCSPDARPRHPDQAPWRARAGFPERPARAPRMQPRLAALRSVGPWGQAAGADGERGRGVVR